MKIEKHQINNINIAEIVSDNIIIETTEDALDVIGNLYYGDFDKVIIHTKNVTPDFFNLKTGIAGEILQKFSNYRIYLAIVGDVTQYAGNNIKDFIIESNKTGHINFVDSIAEALTKLSK